MAGTRPRWNGTAQGLAEIIARHATQPTFIVYGSEAKKTKRAPRRIMGQKAFIRDLASACPNLSFTQTMVKEALEIVAKAKRWPNLDREDDMEHFKELTAKMIRTMMSHVVAGCRKSPGAQWVRMLQLDELVPPTVDDNEPPEPAAEPAANIFVGFEEEVNEHGHREPMCYRVAADGHIAEREYSKDFRIPPNAKQSDRMICIWPDGFTWEVSELTAEDYVELKAGIARPAVVLKKPSAKGAENLLYRGQRSDGSMVAVRRRNDRKMLASMQENGKQICQLQTNKFVGPNGEDGWDICAKVMVEVAKAYVAGDSPKDSLFDLRDRLIADSGLQVAPKVHTPAVSAKQHEKQNKEQNKKHDKKPSKPTTPTQSLGTSNKKPKKENNRLPLPPLDDDWVTMVATGICCGVE